MEIETLLITVNAKLDIIMTIIRLFAPSALKDVLVVLANRKMTVKHVK